MDSKRGNFYVQRRTQLTGCLQPPNPWKFAILKNLTRTNLKAVPYKGKAQIQNKDRYINILN